MTYHHPSYQASYRNDSPSYAFSTAGDAAATADYMVKADLPGYTSRFYSPTEHEQFADIKYDKILVNYDKHFQAVREAAQGFPLEAYIPRSMGAEIGGSSWPAVVVKKAPSADVAKEIEAAQREIKGEAAMKVAIIDTVVDELIIARRRIRKRKIIAIGKQAV